MGPWGCWGRSAGGTALSGASGSGSSATADCLSQVNSRAGISYAVTGVCHQTANRILDPAQCLVSAARGYGVSRMIYGTYGLASAGLVQGAVDWLQQKSRCSGGGHGPKGGGGVGPTRKLKLASQITSLYVKYSVKQFPKGSRISGRVAAESLLQNVGLLQEEAELYSQLMIPNASMAAKIAILDAEVILLQDRVPLVTAVLDGDISGREFAGRTNEFVRSTLERLKDIIGNDVFQQFVGESMVEIPDVVDLEIAKEFFEGHGQLEGQPS